MKKEEVEVVHGEAPLERSILGKNKIPTLPKGVLTINANIPTKELLKLREKYPDNSVDEIFEIK